jgi:hypothetical protein
MWRISGLAPVSRHFDGNSERSALWIAKRQVKMNCLLAAAPGSERLRHVCSSHRALALIWR